MELLPELLTATEVAEACRVHTATVTRWHRDGELRAITLPGGRLRWRRADVEQMLSTPASPASE